MTRLGIYEKALPKENSWKEKFQLAKNLGFDYVEMSIDESDERLRRLNWTFNERQEFRQLMNEQQIQVQSICLSGHRRFPLGSHDSKIRQQAIELGEKAIRLAYDLGIRTIQMAGYDVYYEDKDVTTREYFIKNLSHLVDIAASYNVMLSIEIMDDPFINNMDCFLEIKHQIHSPWLQVYPDLGNLSAWNQNVGYELEKGIDCISAIHIKDTLAVTSDFKGQFRDVPFGEGCVDFLGCFKALHRLNYNGPFVIEMWSGEQSVVYQTIQQAKDYLLPLMKEAGYDV